MPKFNVQMTRLAVVFREEEIEAANEKAAKARALDLYEEDNMGGYGWKIDDIFDDGKPYCKLAIGDVTALDAEGFPIEDLCQCGRERRDCTTSEDPDSEHQDKT